jgi:hypothetical protein
MLNTHVHLVLKLEMSGAVPLRPLYAFVTGTGKTFTSTIINQNFNKICDPQLLANILWT